MAEWERERYEGEGDGNKREREREKGREGERGGERKGRIEIDRDALQQVSGCTRTTKSSSQAKLFAMTTIMPRSCEPHHYTCIRYPSSLSHQTKLSFTWIENIVGIRQRVKWSGERKKKTMFCQLGFLRSSSDLRKPNGWHIFFLLSPPPPPSSIRLSPSAIR